MSVNVNRSVLDQFYRYKMPRLIAKVSSLAGEEETQWSWTSTETIEYLVKVWNGSWPI